MVIQSDVPLKLAPHQSDGDIDCNSKEMVVGSSEEWSLVPKIVFRFWRVSGDIEIKYNDQVWEKYHKMLCVFLRVCQG